jgi:hypothetical protein
MLLGEGAYAHDHSLDSSSQTYAYAVGAYADIATLMAARKLGAPWLPGILYGAAEAGSVSKLEWLLEQLRCQLPADVSNYAVWGGSCLTRNVCDCC